MAIYKRGDVYWHEFEFKGVWIPLANPLAKGE